MAQTLTADDFLPLVASLTPRERLRLLRLIALTQGVDASEFAAEEEPPARHSDG